MIETIVISAMVVAALGLVTREYTMGRRSDWPLLVLGILLGLAVVAMSTWDWIADLGRSGDQATAVAIVAMMAWFTAVGWKHIRPGA